MKRIISLMLSLVIILSLVCGAAPSVSAASNKTTSDNAVTMIKGFEGFTQWPEEDNGQWSVGYGTGVSGEDLEYYAKNGITEAQATKLLKKYLGNFEKEVNEFIDTHSLKLTQNQFDALVSFTYNVGYGWMSDTKSAFRAAVINGTKGNDFIFAMAQFGKVRGQIITGLVKRRLCEANLYLNGVYSNQPPVNYKYITFNSNLEGTIPTVSIQGYDTTMSAAVKASASKTGYRFLGWYTKAEGGSCVTTLGLKTASYDTLYGHWQLGDGERNEDGTIKGVPAEYSGYAPLGAGQKLYAAPGGEEAGSVKDAGTKLNVVAEYIDASGAKWGNLKNGKWIKLGSGLASSPVYEKSGSAIDPITVTVTSSGVNNRVGPGTNYASQGKFQKGQQLVLTAVQKGGNYKWGKSEQGWIALQYTDYETASIMNSDEAKKVTAIGVIIKTDILNVRAGAGVHNAKVGTYNRGDQVKITLQQKVGNTTWGLTEKGWISLYYAKVTKVEDGEVPDINVGGSTGGTTTTPDSSTGSGTGSTTAVQTGRVVNCNTLRIRAGAGTGYAHIGNYANGTYVTIYETTTVRSDTWGRTDKGWICLRYVQLDAPTSGAGVTGRVYNCTELNVRAGAGTHFAKVGKLAKGTKVEILEYTKVGKATWGRTVHGWISLYYVKLDAPITNLDNKVEVDTNTGTGDSTGTGGNTGTGDSAGTGDSTGTGDNTGTGGNTGTGDNTGSGTTETAENRAITVVANDAEGKAVANATVSVWVNPGNNQAHYKLCAAKKTNAEGTAVFDDVALMDLASGAIVYAVVEGEDFVFGWNEDKSNQVRSATAGTGTEVLPNEKQGYLKVTAAAGKELKGSFTLLIAEPEKVERTITVTAVDAEGNPVAGVPFTIQYVENGNLVPATGSLSTGADGKVVFTDGALLKIAKGARLVAEVGNGYAYGWTGAVGGNTVRTATAGKGMTALVSNLQGYLDVTAEITESFDGSFVVTVVKAAE